MKRPLSDFFSPWDFERMYMLSSTITGYCFGCEEPIGQSHYRVTSASNSTTAVVCCKCGIALKTDAIKNRVPGQKTRRPHFTPDNKELAKSKQKETWHTPSFDIGED